MIGVVVLLALTPFIMLLGFGWWEFSRIPKVDVASALSTGGGRSGTNYLLVGTDSREGIDAADPNSGAFIAGEVSGSRTDTIMVLHMEGSATSLVSIPRDLWVKDPASGQMGRINSTFSAGPENLIRSVEALGIPIDHYAEINFTSFASLVDAVGGITVDFEYPAKDDNSGLVIEKPGANRLDGTNALAFVRSRYYMELIDGKWQVDATSDVGRTERQRAFLASLTNALVNERNPFSLVRIPSSVGSGLRIDTTISYPESLKLAWTLKDAKLTSVALPVRPRTTSGGTAVLELDNGSAEVFATLSR
jgi:LCP family protein required for cell wall assembly